MNKIKIAKAPDFCAGKIKNGLINNFKNKIMTRKEFATKWVGEQSKDCSTRILEDLSDLLAVETQSIKEEIEKMYAVELLEYHDKNLLSGNNKSRSVDRQQQLQSITESLLKMISYS